MELTITKPINLEEMMPKNWDICNKISVNHLDDGWYSYYCRKDEVIGSLFRKKFGEDCSSREFFNDNRSQILIYVDELVKDSQNAWSEISKRFGQDYKSLVETTNEIIKTSLDKDITFKKMHEDSSGTNEYAPTISFIKRFYGNNGNGRKIVEVGAGSNGIISLAHLKDHGFETYDIDFFEPEKEAVQKSSIHYIKDRWENIAKHFEENSVDAIYINFMHPSPHYGGPFNKDYSENNWYKYLNDFEAHISKEMKNILKPGGVYIMRQLGAEFISEYLLINRENFKDYSSSELLIENHAEHHNLRFKTEKDDCHGYYSGVMQYPLNPEDKNMYFGRRLIVFQKKA